MTEFETLPDGDVRCKAHGAQFAKSEFTQRGTAYVAPCGCKLSPYGNPFSGVKEAFDSLRRR